MDYINQFDIELEKEIWFPGEKLTGFVIIDSTDDLRVKGIQVLLRGKVCVEWKVTKGEEKRAYKDEQYMLDSKKIIWGIDKSDEGKAEILHKGTHRLPFDFVLPDMTLPCSFESRFGTIRYYVRSLMFVPHMCSPQGVKYFTMVAPKPSQVAVDKQMDPIREEDSQIKCCLCCMSTRMRLRISLDRSVYCGGEHIHICGNVTNNTSQSVWITSKVLQFVEYYVSQTGMFGTEKEVKTTVVECRSDYIHCDITRNLRVGELTLRLPVIPPTLQEISKLIQIYYLLRISMYGDDCKDGEELLELEIPITITTESHIDPITQMKPTVVYEKCYQKVEGGNYISSEFLMGQVYTGDKSESNLKKLADTSDILYQPVYAAVKTDDDGQGKDPIINTILLTPSYKKKDNAGCNETPDDRKKLAPGNVRKPSSSHNSQKVTLETDATETDIIVVKKKQNTRSSILRRSSGGRRSSVKKIFSKNSDVINRDGKRHSSNFQNFTEDKKNIRFEIVDE